MTHNLTEEQRRWLETVRGFGTKEIRPHAAEWDKKGEYPAEVVARMAPLGLLALNIRGEYGGTGLDSVSACIALEELAAADGGTALSIGAHNGLGCAAIALFGSEEQKRRWLPDLGVGR